MPRAGFTVKFPRPPVPRPSPGLRWSLQRVPADAASSAGWEEVAGGPGTHTTYVPCFGNSRAVTKEIL